MLDNSGRQDPDELPLQPMLEPEDADIEIQQGEPTAEELEAPHRAKLRELLVNSKLPEQDKERVKQTIEQYQRWIAEMNVLSSEGDQRVADLVDLLNRYKFSVEFDLI